MIKNNVSPPKLMNVHKKNELQTFLCLLFKDNLTFADFNLKFEHICITLIFHRKIQHFSKYFVNGLKNFNFLFYTFEKLFNSLQILLFNIFL